MTAHRILSSLALLLILSLSGCFSKRDIMTSIPTRTVREIIGQETYVHPTVDASPDLAHYRIIAIKKLDNLMLDQIPVNSYDRLNDDLVRDVAGQKLFSEVLPINDEVELQGDPKDPPILLLDGYVDDYNAGSRALRVAEIGLNHAVLTIRIELKDSRTGTILGAASISVYERGFMRNGSSTIQKAAKTAAEFVGKEMALAQKTHS